MTASHRAQPFTGETRPCRSARVSPWPISTGKMSGESSLWIAFCEVHGALRVGNHRREHGALVPARKLFELETRSTCALDVADGKHDLDEGGQDPRALECRRRGRFGRPDRHRGGIRSSLRQAELRESRLRLPTKRARAFVGVL